MGPLTWVKTHGSENLFSYWISDKIYRLLYCLTEHGMLDTTRCGTNGRWTQTKTDEGKKQVCICDDGFTGYDCETGKVKSLGL